jgi:hypothetical protein
MLGGANTNSMYSTDRSKAYDPVVTAMSSQTLVQVRKAESIAAGSAASAETGIAHE